MPASPIEQALLASDEALAECAQQPMEAGTGSGGNANIDEAKSQTDTDPDDLAAAFFAAEAKEQEAKSRLPTKEWARLFPNLRLQTGPLSGFEDSQVTEVAAHNARQSEIRSLIKERLVQRLHRECTKVLAGKNGGGCKEG